MTWLSRSCRVPHFDHQSRSLIFLVVLAALGLCSCADVDIIMHIRRLVQIFPDRVGLCFEAYPLFVNLILCAFSTQKDKVLPILMKRDDGCKPGIEVQVPVQETFLGRTLLCSGSTYVPCSSGCVPWLVASLQFLVNPVVSTYYSPTNELFSFEEREWCYLLILVLLQFSIFSIARHYHYRLKFETKFSRDHQPNSATILHQPLLLPSTRIARCHLI